MLTTRSRKRACHVRIRLCTAKREPEKKDAQTHSTTKIICVLGYTSFGSLLDGKEITKYRGKIVRKDNQLYFLTVHPAATIYNQKLIDVLKNDIEKLFKLIKELNDNKEIQIDIEYTS